MEWPQWCVLFLFLLNAVGVVVKEVKNRDHDTGEAMVHIFVSWTFAVGYALLLHAGGFW